MMKSDEQALDRFIQDHADALLELFDELEANTGVKQIHVFPGRLGEYLELTVARRTQDTPREP